MDRYDQQIEKKHSLIPVITGLILLILFATWMFLGDKKDGGMDLKTIDIPEEKPLLGSDKKDALEIENKTANNEQQGIKANGQENSLTNQPQLPDLEDSDNLFRDELSHVSTDLSNWFGTKGVIKKYIVLINDISQNQIVFKHRDFLSPPGEIIVKGSSQGLYLTEDSYRRYDNLANAISAIDVDKGLELYLLFKPLFNTVYKGFSYPADYQLEDIFLKAAANIINAPIIEDKIALVRHSVNYSYADKKLESLNNVKKQMIRMGPENTRKIQAKLRKLVQALAILEE